MARKRSAAPDVGDEQQEIIDWYREQLAVPAVVPWAGSKWEPTVIGPTWQRTRAGLWVLPDATLGWDALAWCGKWLKNESGDPWRFTLEQARFLLWWFALDEGGRWLFRDFILQRLKGWGKDPIGACLCAIEAFGPARFAEWDGDRPVATDVPNAWVQTAAVALEQTKNTMRLFPSLFTAEAKAFYRLHVGKEMVHGLGDERLIQAVTSSPATLEGARATFVLLNETQHWKEANQGHEMAGVIARNATKSADGAARTGRITNAYEPSEDSVAQRDREAWEQAEAGQSLTTGILYDSIEAAPEAPLSAEDAPEVVKSIRGDSVWLVPDRIVQAILDTREPPSRSRRFWYNQIVAAEDAWTVPQDFAACADADRVVYDGEEVALFFDGSKSDDATGLVACCMSDGHVVTVGMWQRPPGERGAGWTSPRHDVDQKVDATFERFKVVAFFGDPSHTRDDETQERYWDGLIDEWHRRYKDRLQLWADGRKHSVMWDMTSSARQEAFTAAAERCVGDIEDSAKAAANGGHRVLTHDGDLRLRQHVRNAKRYPNRYGVSLWKGHRESPRKVDLAVCMVGARMVRRDVLNQASQDSGGGWMVVL